MKNQKQRDKLFLLIKTMSRGEKRAFKIFAQKYNKEKNLYIELFNLLDKKQEYDSEYINQKFVEPNGLKKQFSVIKNQLFHLILKGLRSTINEKTTSFRLNEFFENSEILLNRGMYFESLKFLEKCEKTCYELEDYLVLLRVLDKKSSLYTRILKANELKESISKLYHEKSRIRGLLDTENKLERIYQDIYFLYRINGLAINAELKEKYEKLQKELYVSEYNQVLTTKAKHYSYLIQTIYHYALENYQSSLDSTLLHLKLFEENDLFLQSNISDYFKALNNSIALYISFDNKKKIHELIGKLEAFSKNSKLNNRFISQRIFEIKYSSLLSMYVNHMEIEKGLDLVNDIKKGLAEYKIVGLSIDKSMRMSFGISVLYFWKKEWDTCIQWLDEIVNIHDREGPVFLIAYAKILRTICYFEMGNHSLSDSFIRSTRRYLKQHDVLFPIDDSLLKYLKKCIETSNHDQLELKESYQKELDGLVQKETPKGIQSVVNLGIWLKNRAI